MTRLFRVLAAIAALAVLPTPATWAGQTAAPAATAHVLRAKGAITDFLAQRAALIVSSGPDLAGRLDGTDAYNAGNSLGLVLTGQPTELSTSLATSLNRFGRIAHRDPPKGEKAVPDWRAYGPLDGRMPSPSTDRLRPSFDAWVGARWNHAADDTSANDFGTVSIGADYRLDPSLLIGLFAEGDWMRSLDAAAATTSDGAGWMLGPYLEKRLDKGLVFDGRVGWGTSGDSVASPGMDASAYRTMRWFAKGRLSGDYGSGDWRFSPQVSAVYFGSDQPDSGAGPGGGQIMALGSMSFGPSVSYAVHGDGSTLTPGFGISGIWDFADVTTVDLETGLADALPADVHARAELKIPVRLSNGVEFGAKAYYDGIGVGGFHPYGGSVQVTVPLG
jgi:hypothetical protein